MNEHPILFSGPMISALMDDRKSQTRRIIKPQPILVGKTWTWPCDGIKSKASWADFIKSPDSMLRFCPYGKVGDLLWVKESFRYGIFALGCGGKAAGIEYKINGRIKFLAKAQKYARQKNNKDKARQHARWRSSLFMPKWAARIWRPITGIRVERLQEISEADVLAEGFRDVFDGKMFFPAAHFLKQTWNSLHAKWKRVYDRQLKIYEFWQFPWSAEDAKPIPKTTAHPERYHCIPNPWVFVIEFKNCQCWEQKG